MLDATVENIQQGLAASLWSSRSLVEHYLARIETIDYNGVTLHSVIETNPDALAIADELDSAFCNGDALGPLHGVPILVKDNIDTGDRMLTTAGSLALATAPAPRDAFVVEKLRTAGAVILGKTNMSEWANFRGKHSVSGWSARGGQCLNPYALNRTPCGSSSGSAVAVAINLCVASVGTETDGSIVCPASMNCIVGLKPTLGLISRTGVIPIAHSQDTVGPMGRNVRDVAMLLNVLARPDPRDPATRLAEGKIVSDYTKFLNPNALSGARVGVARKFFGFNAATDRLIDRCIEAMKTNGAILVDSTDLPSHDQLDVNEREVLTYEFKADLNEYLKSRSNSVRVHSLADIIAFNEQHRSEEMPYFDQEWMVEANAKGPLSEKAYLDALAKNHQLSREEGIDAVMKAHNLDAIVAPTTSPAWLTDFVNGDHETGGCSQPAAVAGYPHITVPAGFVAGLPVGISFFASAWSESTLLGLAYAFEQTIQARMPPRFLRTADLRNRSA
jgi:amidase